MAKDLIHVLDGSRDLAMQWLDEIIAEEEEKLRLKELKKDAEQE